MNALQKMLRDARLEGIRMGLEAAAKVCSGVEQRYPDMSDEFSNGARMAGNYLQHAIRAIDPESVK